MKIIINSHKNSTIALNHLLESMRCQTDFCDFEIIIAIGGYYDLLEYEIFKEYNITQIKCNHNSIDWTALIVLAECYNNDINEYYFYLHDTCKVGKNFFSAIKLIDLNNITSLRLMSNPPHDPSKNLGIYSQKIINDFKLFLLSKKNTDEKNLLKCKSINYNEDYIFNNDKCNKLLKYEVTVSEPYDYYKTGTLRKVYYYKEIDLYKMQANWGRGWTLNN